MDAALTRAAQPGLGVGARRRRPRTARQPPPEHRALRDLRRRRPAARRRGRQRPPVRAAVRGGRAAGPRRRRALRHQRRARGARRRAGRAARRRVFATRGADDWVGGAARGGRARRADQRRRRRPSALAEALGLEPVAEAGGMPLPAPPLRLDGERPAVRLPPPRLDEHGDDAARVAQLWRAASAWRIVFGSMKRTSSRSTSNSSTSLRPARAEEVDEPLNELLRRARARGDADDARVLEPLLAHLRLVVDQVRRRRPQSRATSTSRCEFEELREPITSTRSHCSAICLTASWRFVVA